MRAYLALEAEGLRLEGRDGRVGDDLASLSRDASQERSNGELVQHCGKRSSARKSAKLGNRVAPEANRTAMSDAMRLSEAIIPEALPEKARHTSFL